jgi:class 3 adenylate cyclase
MWDQDRSKERVSKQWDTLNKTGITIKRLSREMDLTNLSPTDVRIVHGSHLYLDITNISNLVENATLRREDFKPLHRYMHVLRVELRRIIQNLFDGDKMQVQGAKFHGLLYKPYDDDATLAWHSVLVGIAFMETVRKSLPKVFPDYPTMTPTVGIDLGDAIVANIGVRGDRELISVGSAANHAAKILGTANAITVTPELWQTLSGEHQELFAEDGDNYRLDWLSAGDPEQTIRDAGFSWSVDQSTKRMLETVDSLPLSDIQSHQAESRIELSALGPKHFKTCMAGSIFVDIDGYTSLIESLMDNEEELAKAVTLLHLFRHELQCITEADFDGVTIQHQGDRLQAIIHLPNSNDDRIKEKMVEMAISYNSSVEDVINAHQKASDKYHVAIGTAYGKTVVVRSGTKGDLDAGCFGDAVLGAENLQLRSKGSEMRIAKDVFAAIGDEAVRGQFQFESQNDCYKATNLTWSKIEDAQNSKHYAAKATVGFNTLTRGVEFERNNGPNVSRRPEVVPVKNTRNWGL